MSYITIFCFFLFFKLACFFDIWTQQFTSVTNIYNPKPAVLQAFRGFLQACLPACRKTADVRWMNEEGFKNTKYVEKSRPTLT
jgi:hypothetical protein